MHARLWFRLSLSFLFFATLYGCASIDPITPYELESNVSIPSKEKALAYLQSHIPDDSLACKFTADGVLMQNRTGLVGIEAGKVPQPYDSLQYSTYEHNDYFTATLSKRKKDSNGFEFCWAMVLSPRRVSGAEAIQRTADTLAALRGLGVKSVTDYSGDSRFKTMRYVSTRKFYSPEADDVFESELPPLPDQTQPCNKLLRSMFRLEQLMKRGCQSEYNQASNSIRLYGNRQLGYIQTQHAFGPFESCSLRISRRAGVVSSQLPQLANVLRRYRCVPENQIASYVGRWSGLVQQARGQLRILGKEEDQLYAEFKQSGSQNSNAAAEEAANKRSLFAAGLGMLAGGMAAANGASSEQATRAVTTMYSDVNSGNNSGSVAMMQQQQAQILEQQRQQLHAMEEQNHRYAQTHAQQNSNPYYHEYNKDGMVKNASSANRNTTQNNFTGGSVGNTQTGSTSSQLTYNQSSTSAGDSCGAYAGRWERRAGPWHRYLELSGGCSGGRFCEQTLNDWNNPNSGYDYHCNVKKVRDEGYAGNVTSWSVNGGQVIVKLDTGKTLNFSVGRVGSATAIGDMIKQ